MGYNHVADNTTFIYTPAIDASQICEFREFCDNSIYSSRSSKVINLGANRKRMCNFLLVINGNFGRISLSYRFRDIGAFSSKIACFAHHALVWRPVTKNALRHQRIIYDTIRYDSNDFSVEIIQTCKSSKVIDIGVNGKRMCDFLFISNSNSGRISTVFEILTFELEND